MGRDQAVEALQQMGFVARPRDWALGQTIFITVPELQFEHAGITGTRAAAYLWEAPEGWRVWDSDFSEQSFSSFDDAVAYLRSFFAGKVEQWSRK
jgi:hypothetical protein